MKRLIFTAAAVVFLSGAAQAGDIDPAYEGNAIDMVGHGYDANSPKASAMTEKLMNTGLPHVGWANALDAIMTKQHSMCRVMAEALVAKVISGDEAVSATTEACGGSVSSDDILKRIAGDQ